MIHKNLIITIILALMFAPAMLIASGNPQSVPGRDGEKLNKDQKVVDAVITIHTKESKKISEVLWGIFFEDLNYAADGGLYAELIQNRSFEYSPSDIDNWHDKSNWHSLSAWEYTTKGYGYGTISVETSEPIHQNNPHYVVLDVEDEGQEGVGLINSGFDGIVIKAGEKYNFSVFTRQLSNSPIPFEVTLINKNGDACGKASFTTGSKDWKKYAATITATQSSDSCRLVILAKAKGKFAMDVISLFPQNTFKNRPNGLRADLAQTIADLKPKFMRFPGGCLVHGDGLGNMYRWKNTIGPIEQRVEQRNIWSYHQSVGLGYFEYFQFCEDIGAKPLPVVPAAVSCQNSGGTWRIGSTGQKSLPLDEMPAYIQEVLDLIEYANGPASSTWGAKRAEAGHPKPFNLEYLGIGNEDKQTPEFRERFKMIYDVVKEKHPEITIIGTVGPNPADEDYDKGWKFANENKLEMVDEHCYKEPEWFFENLNRFDSYDRKASEVYIGEFAAHDLQRKNTLRSALAEAAYMCSLERNGDVVSLASYAPLLAKEGHTQWNPDLIYFNNTEVKPSVNYYVQQLFGQNSGNEYLASTMTLSDTSEITAKHTLVSVVKDSKSGDLMIKLVNFMPSSVKAQVELKGLPHFRPNAIKTVLAGMPDDLELAPQTSVCEVANEFSYELPAYSFTVIRIKTN